MTSLLSWTNSLLPLAFSISVPGTANRPTGPLRAERTGACGSVNPREDVLPNSRPPPLCTTPGLTRGSELNAVYTLEPRDGIEIRVSIFDQYPVSGCVRSHLFLGLRCSRSGRL